MNFYSIRYTIIAIIMLIVVIIFLKITKKQITSKKTIIVFIIFVIVYELAFSIIPENQSLIFDSIEKAMQYSFPSEKIINKIDGDKVIFVEYGKDEHNTSYTYVVKENEKIKFKNPKENDDIRFFIFDYGTGAVIKTEQEKTLVLISCIQVKGETQDILISDTIDSKFESTIYENELGYLISYYTILNDEDITEDYYLVINERLVNIKPYLK